MDLDLHDRAGIVVGRTVVDDSETWTLRFSWSRHNLNGYVYASRGEKGQTRLLHRELLGVTDPLILVDHINGDTLDNRRGNLRVVTRSQNAFNAKVHRDNKTGFKGVYFDKQTGLYRAQIMAEGKRVSLGRYATPEEAAEAYDKACRELHGEHAKPNKESNGALHKL
jgi:hypothetical protein